jgi:hypothetical protein
MGWPSIAGSGTCLIRSALPMWTLTTARLVRKAADGSPLWDGTGWYDDTLVHTPGGWRICGRICRITWWTGNPSVNEGIPGVKFDLATSVLRREADAGRIGVLGAHANPDV